MIEADCEQICEAAMAIGDGEAPGLTLAQIEGHIATCAGCRQEIEDLRTLSVLLGEQKRQHQAGTIWTNIEDRLPDLVPLKRATSTGYTFLILGILLLGFRLIEVIPDRNLSLVFKLVPVLFVAAVFGYLKENPFKINGELRLEGE